MASEPQTITITPDIELETVLDAAENAPVRLVRGQSTFVIHREPLSEAEDIWANYDAEAIRESLEAMAGTWADIDADALIEELYRAREEGSRPIDRPQWPT